MITKEYLIVMNADYLHEVHNYTLEFDYYTYVFLLNYWHPSLYDTYIGNISDAYKLLIENP